MHSSLNRRKRARLLFKMARKHRLLLLRSRRRFRSSCVYDIFYQFKDIMMCLHIRSCFRNAAGFLPLT